METVELPAGTVTFLLTDVEGSTAALVADYERARESLRRIDDTISAVTSAHHGVRPIEQGEGDSAVVAFASALDALRAARALQHALGSDGPRVRVGISTGEVQPESGRYSALVLHHTARLRDAAHGGQVLVSSITRALTGDAEAFVDLGRHRLRDLGAAEHVYQLDTGESFPPLRSLAEIPNNLPPQPTSFIGRAAELDELADLVTGNRLVTIVGAGGCGKRRLALQSVAQVADRFEDGAWWVDLASVNDPELARAALRRVFGLGEELTDPLAAFLRDRSLCVVLDNCEHLLEAAAALAATLNSARGVHVVTSTREPLALPGEVVWRAPSMSTADAASLFTERARLIQRDFAPDEVVDRICERLDGIPLAIELAAARVATMSTSEIAAGLDDRFRLLTGGPRGVAARQRTLEASIEWSYNLLSDTAQAILRRLSVFAADFTLDAARVLIGDDARDALAALVNQSLVAADTSSSETRFRLLESVRQFGYARLEAAGEAIEARNAHAEYVRDLAAKAATGLESVEMEAWITTLVGCLPDLRNALEWSFSGSVGTEWIDVVADVGSFWPHSGDYREALTWTGRALEATQGEHSARRLALLRADAWLAGSIPDFDRHHRGVNAGIELARATGERTRLGQFLLMRAYGDLLTDPTVNPLEVFVEGLEIARSVGDQRFIAFGASMIASAAYMQDRFDTAEALLDEASAAATKAGDRQMQATCLLGRSFVAHMRADAAGALHYADDAVRLLRSTRDLLARQAAAAARGWALARAGRYAEAEIELTAMAEAAERTGTFFGAPWLGLALHDTFLWSGQLSRALGALESWLTAGETIFRGFNAYYPRVCHGEDLARLGEVERARTVLSTAVRDAAGYPRLQSLGLAAQARIEEDTARAEDLEHQALELRRKFGIWVEVPPSLEALAGFASRAGNDDEAAVLLGAAASARIASGFPVPLIDRPAVEALTARVRELPGWKAGAAMTLDEAIAYATRARGRRGRPALGWSSLTPTELDVVGLVVKGLTNPEIGAKMHISRATVKSHLSHIFTKVGVSNRAELAAVAARHAEGV